MHFATNLLPVTELQTFIEIGQDLSKLSAKLCDVMCVIIPRALSN